MERLNDEGRELLRSRLRYVLTVSSFLYLSFYGLDFVLVPEHYLVFLGLRLFVVFNYLVGIALLSSRHGPRIAAPLFSRFGWRPISSTSRPDRYA